MVTKRVRSTEDIDRQILDFCDQFDQIVEARFVVSKVNQIAKNLRKSLKEHTRLRQEVTMQRLRAAWGRFMESATSDFSAYVFDLDEEAALLESLFTPFYVESGQFGAVLATERLSRILHREILYRGSRAWVHDNAIRFGRRYARSVSQTTNKAIRAEIMDAIKNGEGIDELMVRVQNVYRSVSTYRSEMISRTEMGRGFNISRLIQDKKFGLDSYDWVGCDPKCEVCGPFMRSSPHNASEIQSFILGGTHPNCEGTEAARVPPGFEPNLN